MGRGLLHSFLLIEYNKRNRTDHGGVDILGLLFFDSNFRASQWCGDEGEDAGGNQEGI